MARALFFKFWYHVNHHLDVVLNELVLCDFKSTQFEHFLTTSTNGKLVISVGINRKDPERNSRGGVK